MPRPKINTQLKPALSAQVEWQTGSPRSKKLSSDDGYVPPASVPARRRQPPTQPAHAKSALFTPPEEFLLEQNGQKPHTVSAPSGLRRSLRSSSPSMELTQPAPPSNRVKPQQRGSTNKHGTSAPSTTLKTTAQQAAQQDSDTYDALSSPSAADRRAKRLEPSAVQYSTMNLHRQQQPHQAAAPAAETNQRRLSGYQILPKNTTTSSASGNSAHVLAKADNLSNDEYDFNHFHNIQEAQQQPQPAALATSAQGRRRSTRVPKGNGGLPFLEDDGASWGAGTLAALGIIADDAPPERSHPANRATGSSPDVSFGEVLPSTRAWKRPTKTHAPVHNGVAPAGNGQAPSPRSGQKQGTEEAKGNSYDGGFSVFTALTLTVPASNLNADNAYFSQYRNLHDASIYHRGSAVGETFGAPDDDVASPHTRNGVARMGSVRPNYNASLYNYSRPGSMMELLDTVGDVADDDKANAHPRRQPLQRHNTRDPTMANSVGPRGNFGSMFAPSMSFRKGNDEDGRGGVQSGSFAIQGPQSSSSDSDAESEEEFLQNIKNGMRGSSASRKHGSAKGRGRTGAAAEEEDDDDDNEGGGRLVARLPTFKWLPPAKQTPGGDAKDASLDAGVRKALWRARKKQEQENESSTSARTKQLLAESRRTRKLATRNGGGVSQKPETMEMEDEEKEEYDDEDDRDAADLARGTFRIGTGAPSSVRLRSRPANGNNEQDEDEAEAEAEEEEDEEEMDDGRRRLGYAPFTDGPTGLRTVALPRYLHSGLASSDDGEGYEGGDDEGGGDGGVANGADFVDMFAGVPRVARGPEPQWPPGHTPRVLNPFRPDIPFQRTNNAVKVHHLLDFDLRRDVRWVPSPPELPDAYPNGTDGFPMNPPYAAAASPSMMGMSPSVAYPNMSGNYGYRPGMTNGLRRTCNVPWSFS